MRIGILTFFESNNYGTVLQAYALQCYLEEQGHQTKLIYLKRKVEAKSAHFAKNVRKYTLLQRFWTRAVMLKQRNCGVIKKQKFEDFRKEHLHITSKCYETAETLLEDIGEYDLIISGGDQVWNPYHKVFSLNYMLDFLPEGVRRISYGSSFGIDKIEDRNVLDAMKKQLCKYEKIGVRELSGVRIVETMGIEAKQVLDPVFLLQGQWEKFVDKESPVKGKYGLVYALVDYTDENDQHIKQYAKEKKLKMVIMPENRRNCINTYKKAFDLSPIEFLNYIAHSEVVFTNSFHGLVFAILFKKKVVILEPTTAEAKSKQTRLLEILKQFGMQFYDFNNINEMEDYDICSEFMTMKIKESKDYLLDSLK